MTDGLVQMRYRRAISQFATGVAVITTSVPGGLAGMTASAVTSLSLDPVQLLVCVGNTLLTRSAIAERGRFAVNVLGADGEHLRAPVRIAKARQVRRPQRQLGLRGASPSRCDRSFCLRPRHDRAWWRSHHLHR